VTHYEYRYCPCCSAELQKRVIHNAERPVCPACGWVYYADPKVAAATLVVQDGKILLVQRANEPHSGAWSLPAGFVDADEDPAQAAQREVLEEAGFQVAIIDLIDLYTGREHPRGSDLLLVFRADITGGSLHAGDDALDAAFFSPDRLPPLAFDSTRRILEKTFKIRL